MTFINKMDREARDPLELLDEIDDQLALDTAPDELADRHGPELQGRVRPDRPRPRAAGRGQRAELGGASCRAATATAWRPACRTGQLAELREQLDLVEGALPAFDARELSRGPSDARVLRQRAAQFRRPRPARRARRATRPRRGRSRPTSAPSSPARTRSPASSSRSRPTWTPSIATASPSCGCARAGSSAA